MASSPKSSIKRSAPKRRRKKTTDKGATSVSPNSKTALLIELLSAPKGATPDELVKKIGWQPHSLRGAISGTLKKKMGLTVTSSIEDGRGRVYRIRKDA
jgi:hypothetical protein